MATYKWISITNPAGKFVTTINSLNNPQAIGGSAEKVPPLNKPNKSVEIAKSTFSKGSTRAEILNRINEGRGSKVA